MKIKVEQNHIDNGVPANPNFCPVAMALRDAGACAAVCRYITYFYTSCDNRLKQVATPEVVRKFTLAFDGGQGVMPFEFEIDIDVNA